MKFSHNKKRNTAFIFEVLIKELTKSSINEECLKKATIVDILKEFFSKNKLLKRDLEIYKSFDDITTYSRDLAKQILDEAKKQYSSLNRQKVFNEQSKIINKMNKSLGMECWNDYISNYKKLATVSQAISQGKSPKKQVLAEKKLLDTLLDKQTEERQLPKVNNLAMNTFIERFNQKYSNILTENQKTFLSKYINSNDENNLELKAYLYEEIENINKFLVENKNSYGQDTSGKIQKILERIENYNKKKFDDELVFEVLRVQSLVGELQNHGN